MSANLKKKIRVRAGHEAYVTKTISEVGKVIGEVDLRKLRSIQSILRDKLSEIKALDREIVEETREENIDQEVADSCEFATCIYDCIEDIEVVFRENECVGKESPAATPQFSAHGSSSNQQATNARAGQPPQTGIEKVLWKSSGMVAVLGLV